ncbi:MULTISPECIES: spore coat U domain-containing protein [unclassified Caballeronia]|uniref:Csu type fimbrial protein n=1 Tax=unclassified Caballeronia TaxID=2646786 RepID=UPI002027A3BF|nr:MULTISPECIES: spore coat U domain-containing protein [unclassified Caballeronia]
MNTALKAMRLALLATSASAALLAAPVNAATDTTSFGVKITITSTCDIHSTPATDVDFGTVSSTATNVDQAGTLNIKCTKGTTYKIALDNGQNADTGGQRRMKQVSGSNTYYVNYNLYQNSGRTTAWGAAVADSYAGSGTGANQSISVYGRVPDANVQAGSYTDTVTATVTY